ncbi:MAG: (Fe-S)-binding protein [Thermoplasmata archaeon]
MIEMAAPVALPVMDGLKSAEDMILTCTMCGYCKESCPFFNVIGWDSNTSRGRILLSYALLHKMIPPDEKTIENLFKCTLCRRCEVACSSRLKILEIFEAVRRDIARSGMHLPPHKAVLRNIDEGGNIYADRTPSTEMHDEREHPAPVAFFAGCVSTYANRKPALNTRKLLKRLGVDYTMINEMCCGYPQYLLGADFSRVARENLSRLEGLGVKEVVLSCDGCYRMFKEAYPKVRKSDIKVRHIAELLAENLDRLPSPKSRQTVTYHDSCDLGRHMKMYDLPRKVLSRFADIKEMRSTKEQALCCGTGGGVRIAFSGEADGIAARRLEEAGMAAEVMVTTCPACAHTMGVVAKKKKSRVQPVTLAQFVEEAIEREEKR